MNIVTTASSRLDLAIGIDVGGTKSAAVVTDGDDQLLLHEVVATEPDRLVEQIVELATRARQRLAAEGRDAHAVGVAIPGHVDSRAGTLGLAVNLGLPSLPLAALLEEALELPCVVEHDARAAARWLRGRTGESKSDLAYLSIGTGISAGVVTDDRPLVGDNGFAGEVGHVVAEPDGPRCACGLDGCLEAVAAGPAIERLARQAIAAGRPTSLPHEPSARDVFGAAADGDAVACEIVATVARYLARAVRGLVLSFGVNRVVIGGGVAGAGQALLEPLLEAVGRESAQSPLVDSAFAHASIEMLPPQVEAGARGVAALARHRAQFADGEEVGDA